MPRLHSPAPAWRNARAVPGAIALLLVSAALSAGGGAAAPGPARVTALPRYTVIDLTPYGSPPLSAQAADLNDSGEVTGSYQLRDGTFQAFRTAPLSRMIPENDLLGSLESGRSSGGVAINNAGQVGGYATIPGGGWTHGFRTEPHGLITAASDLGGIPPPSDPTGPGHSQVDALNNNGVAAGRAMGQAFKTAGQVTPATQMGTLFPDPARPGAYLGDSAALAINDAGVVAGYSSYTNDRGHITSRLFRSAGAKITPADDIGPGGWVEGINRTGQVVGITPAGDGSGRRLGFLTAPNGKITSTLPLLPGADESWAMDVNDQGEAVGACNALVGPNQRAQRAVLWDNGRVVDLNTLIDPASRWTLTVAFGINNRGHILAEGSGPQGSSRAVLLIPLPQTDLSVTATRSPSQVRVGDELTFNLTVRNGSEAAPETLVRVELPANTVFVRSVPVVIPSAQVVEFQLNTLRAGGSAALQVAVRCERAGTGRFTANVSGRVADPNAANNTAVLDITVNPGLSADLSVGLLDSPDPVKVGQPLTYSLTLSNAGPDPAAAVEVEHRLPAGVTFVSARTTQGSCARSGNSLLCSLGRVTKGAVPRITVVVTPTVAGVLNTEATVSADEQDPVPGNNRATAQTTVLAGPKRPDLVGQWAPITYTFKVPPRSKNRKKAWVMESAFTVRNAGQKLAKPCRVAFYASTDQDPGRGDKRFVKEQKIKRLPPGRSQVIKIAEVVPRKTDGSGSQLKGLYALGVVDSRNTVKESREDNNLAVSGQLP